MYRAFVERETGTDRVVYVNNYRIPVSVERGSVARGAEILHIREGESDSRELSIISPMPGLVRKVLVQVGETVAAGTVLLILEAMKMENEVRSPRPGIVSEVGVVTGMNVEKGRKLMSLGAE